MIPLQSGGGGAVLLIYLFFLAIWLAVCWLVAQDASDHGHSGLGWGIATFLFGIPAVLIYALLVR